MSKHPEKMTVHELYERLTMDGIDATKIKGKDVWYNYFYQVEV